MPAELFSDNPVLGYTISFGSDPKEFTVTVYYIPKEEFPVPALSAKWERIDLRTVRGSTVAVFVALDNPRIAAANVEAALVAWLVPKRRLTV